MFETIKRKGFLLKKNPDIIFDTVGYTKGSYLVVSLNLRKSEVLNNGSK